MSKKPEAPKSKDAKQEPKPEATKPETGQENPEGAKFAEDSNNLINDMEDLLGRVGDEKEATTEDQELDDWLADFGGESEDDGEEMTLEEAQAEYKTLSEQVSNLQKQTTQTKADNVYLQSQIDTVLASVAADKAEKTGALIDAVSEIGADISKVAAESDEKDNTDDRLDSVTEGLKMVDKQLSDIFGKYAVKKADAPEATAPSQEAPKADTLEDLSTCDDIDKIFDALDELDQEIVTLTSESNKANRAKQDLVSQLQRAERDAEKQKQSGIKKLATELLDVADNLDRAKACITDEMRKDSADIDGTVKDIEALSNKLQAAFNASGIEKIEAKGKKFDPTIHEAITAIPMPDVENDHVADVMQDGYTLNKNLLRAPKVVVCKK